MKYASDVRGWSNGNGGHGFHGKKGYDNGKKTGEQLSWRGLFPQQLLLLLLLPLLLPLLFLLPYPLFREIRVRSCRYLPLIRENPRRSSTQSAPGSRDSSTSSMGPLPFSGVRLETDHLELKNASDVRG
jgi:hypothetical protein